MGELSKTDRSATDLAAPEPYRDAIRAQDVEQEPASDKTPPVDEALLARLERIPNEPGVYLLKDRHGKVIYVGKAKSLRSRVRAYFRERGDSRPHVRFLISR